MLKLWRKVSITVTLDGELWFQQFGDRMHKSYVSKIMMDAMHPQTAQNNQRGIAAQILWSSSFVSAL